VVSNKKEMYITANLIQKVMKNQVVAVLGLITCIAIGFTQPAFSQGSWGVEA
jgi:hypothetical protein